MNSFQMKKLAVSSIVAAAMFAASGAQAATVTQDLDVSVDLSAACQIQGAPIANPVLDFGVYTAFVSAATPAPTANFVIECTRGLAGPTYSFDGATGYGVLAGLNYLVSAADGGATAGTAATAAAGQIGTPDTYTITLTGAMDPLQAGACAGVDAATCAGVQTATRTLTITY